MNNTRRSLLKRLGATGGIAAVAGCSGDSDDREFDDTDTQDDTGENDDRDTDGTEDPERDLPRDPEEWGQRLNAHAMEADIDWTQFEDEEITLRFATALHPHAVVTAEVISAFEALTGIAVEYDILPEDEYWITVRNDLGPDGEGRYDGVLVTAWRAGELHQSGLLSDLIDFLEDPGLTDRSWLSMDDVPDGAIDRLTFPNDVSTETGDLIGFPHRIEADGCVGCDRPTFEAIDDLADDPRDQIQDFDDLEETARIIAESDVTDRAGIVSRTSTGPQSSATWATMFRTDGGEWIDRSAGGNREARLASRAGIRSLERFGHMMRAYGPADPGQYDWYRATDALSVGDTAMIYTTPSTAGAIRSDQFRQTTWLPPLSGPDGDAPRAAANVWATGISTRSENPRAAWLFIQWLNSRVGNYMLSTHQWQGHTPRGGAARPYFLRDMLTEGVGESRDNIAGMPEVYPDREAIGISESWLEAHVTGVETALAATIPSVPMDTAQNIPIMTEVARAMNAVVRGETDAETALKDVEDEITGLASRIDDRYLVTR